MTPRLSRRVALETRHVVADGGGGESATWVRKGTLWASFRPSSGREGLIGEQIASRVSHRVRVRGAPIGSPRRPQAAERLRMGTRIFDILAVTEDDDQGAYFLLWVVEGSLS
ncbi:MAG: phage head closure protein [Pseudomonadota bacterium]